MMGNDDYRQRNLKPSFSTALARTPSPQKTSRYRYGEEEGGGLNWLVTFTDIMGLMLTFFVMMYAMSVPEKERFEEISRSLSTQLNHAQEESALSGPEDSPDMQRISFTHALDLGYLEAVIGAALEQDEVLDRAGVIWRQGDRLVLSMPGLLEFPEGGTRLEKAATDALFTLGGAFSRIRNRLEINAYAVDRGREQNQKQDLASSLALSLRRAATVAASLERSGYTDPVMLRSSVTDSRKPQDESQGEKAEIPHGDLSRRVDIVIMNHDGRNRRGFRN